MLERKNMEQDYQFSEKAWEAINRIADGATLHPDLPRKPREERVNDLANWLNRYHYHCAGYNELGFDVAGFDRWDEYVEHYTGHLEEFENLPFYRYGGILAPRPADAIISDDKYLFYTYVNDILPGCTPKVYLKMRAGQVLPGPNEEKNGLDEIAKLPDGVYICKPSNAACGKAVVKLEVRGHKLILPRRMTLRAFSKALRSRPYVVQEYIRQHPALAAFNPASVNTVRIITARFHRTVHYYTAILRVGVGDNVVDNAAAGGTFVHIDEESGTLGKFGLYHNRPAELKHPVSGLAYEGFQIPFWKESVDLVKFLHRFFPFSPTLGWDVAITEKGPVVIENNYDWSYDAMQHAAGGLRAKLNELKNL